MRIRHVASAFLLFASALLLTSCDHNNLAEVHGTVSFNGQIVEKGAILFTPEAGDAPAPYGGPIENGKYHAKVPPGSMKVSISWLKETGKTFKPYNTPDSPEKAVLDEAVPERFNKKTELRYEVQRGSNEKSWDLKAN